MKTLDELRAEFFGIWRSTEIARSIAKPFDLDAYLGQSFSRTNAEVTRLIPTHMFLLAESVSCYILFAKLLRETKQQREILPFVSQVHRVTNCLIGIRLLLLSGLEDTCRPVTRTWLESMDIALACLIDRELSVLFLSDDEIEFDSIWKTKIAYGKIYEYISRAFELAGLSASDANDYIKHRRTQKTLLSSSVHGDDSGAFRNMAPPPLGYPAMISIDPHGVVSFHTADHAAAVIGEAYRYLSLLLKILMRPDEIVGVDLPREGSNTQVFFAHFFAFQELYYRHDLPASDSIISPDYAPQAN